MLTETEKRGEGRGLNLEVWKKMWKIHKNTGGEWKEMGGKNGGECA